MQQSGAGLAPDEEMTVKFRSSTPALGMEATEGRGGRSMMRWRRCLGMTMMLVLCAEYSQAASSQPCGSCIFDVSDDGMLSRTGSCASDCTDLDLSNRTIKSITVGVFSGLTSLQYLYLDNNQLTALPAGVFDGLSGLLQIFLNGNALTCVASDAFSTLTHLNNLSLTDNPLSCSYASWPSFALIDPGKTTCASDFTCMETPGVAVDYERNASYLSHVNVYSNISKDCEDLLQGFWLKPTLYPDLFSRSLQVLGAPEGFYYTSERWKDADLREWCNLWNYSTFLDHFLVEFDRQQYSCSDGSILSALKQAFQANVLELVDCNETIVYNVSDISPGLREEYLSNVLEGVAEILRSNVPSYKNASSSPKIIARGPNSGSKSFYTLCEERANAVCMQCNNGTWFNATQGACLPCICPAGQSAARECKGMDNGCAPCDYGVKEMV
eukprot:758602-Hanusia_phi.AAC.4